MTDIKALARHLNVSIGTVSRALNGRAEVSEATRLRVLAAARELHYVANQSGRALRQGTTNVIGFVMESRSDPTGEQGNFFTRVFDGVQSVLSSHNLDLVVLPCSLGSDPMEFIRRVVARSFADGLIISATRREDRRISYLVDSGIPFVMFGRSLSDAQSHPWLDLDFEAMARSSVDRLVARGHRRIVAVLPKDELNLVHVFVEEFQSSLRRNGLPDDPAALRFDNPNEEGGFSVAVRLAAEPTRPTAVVLADQAMTFGFYHGLRHAGLVPGKDIGVIGQHGPHARLLSPSLTGFQVDLTDLGVELAKSLLATMPTHRKAYRQSTIARLWPADLIEGESDEVWVAPDGTLVGNEVRHSDLARMAG